MPRVNGNLIPILQATLEQLARAVPWANKGNCFLTLWDNLELKAPPAGDVWATVSPGDGVVDAELWDGGGREQVATHSRFSVTIHTSSQLDQAGRDTAALLSPKVGLYAKAMEVINALAGYEPTAENGDELCRESIMPLGYRFPERTERSRASVIVDFRVLLDLDLPAEVP